MTATIRKDVPIALEAGGVELRTQVIGGGFSVLYVTLPQGTDMGPAFKGLPGDACQCPHWGYLFKGRILMHTPEGDETYEAGQAYYFAPGHVPEALEDCELVEFSPTDEIRRVLDHVTSAMG